MYIPTKNIQAAQEALRRAAHDKARSIDPKLLCDATRFRDLLQVQPYLFRRGNSLSLISVKEAVKLLKEEKRGIPANEDSFLPEAPAESRLTQSPPTTTTRASVMSVEVPSPLRPFGKAEWSFYFGDVGEEPSLPSDIGEILQSHCPFHGGLTVGHTHLLALIPQALNGQPFNINELLKISPRFWFYWIRALTEHGHQVADASHWVLMLRGALPESTGKPYQEQVDLLSNICRRTGVHYEVASLLDTVTCVSLERKRTGTSSDAKNPKWVHVQEQTQGRQLVVGNFDHAMAGFDHGMASIDFFPRSEITPNFDPNIGIAVSRILGI